MIARLALCCGVITAGLPLRLFGIGLGIPAVVVKYGGSVLWATMLYLLVAAALGHRPRLVIAGTAMGIAVLVELFRLYHAPWLDAFRLALPGALLLGRIFSLWNIAAYAAGVMAGALVDPGQGRARPDDPSLYLRDGQPWVRSRRAHVPE